MTFQFRKFEQQNYAQFDHCLSVLYVQPQSGGYSLQGPNSGFSRWLLCYIGTFLRVTAQNNHFLFRMLLMSKRSRFFTPFSAPIYLFLITIIAGAVLLHFPFCLEGEELSWLDAFFTSTSAVCVTGLAVVDTGTHFSHVGQAVILTLIQLGGLGIMTYTSLVFYLWRRRISLFDRIAVGQTLLHDPVFRIGRFLFFVFLSTFLIEGIGAFLIRLAAPNDFSLWSAVFHSISAFCNAGFSLYSDSLYAWRNNTWINLIFIVLITLGGLGFSVLSDIAKRLNEIIARKFKKATHSSVTPLQFHSHIVLSTSFFLVMAGFILIYATEALTDIIFENNLHEGVLVSLFQSVTCRTAGFNTVHISDMTNVSLAIMILLMLIGGSPGSTAGGIKTTTFRTIIAFIGAQFRGRPQAVIGRRAVDAATLNKALILVVTTVGIVVLSTLLLSFSEAAGRPHTHSGGLFLELLFECVSALATVGLSTGITPSLSVFGKIIIILLMFVGRLGPVLFITVLQSWQKPPHYAWPEDSCMIG